MLTILATFALAQLGTPPNNLAREDNAPRTVPAEWPDPVPEDVTTLSLDALIDALPPIRREERMVFAKDGVSLELHPLTLEFGRRVGAGAQPSAEQWRRVFERTGNLRFRTRWPAGERVWMYFRRPSRVFREMELAPRQPDWLTWRKWNSSCGMDIESTFVPMHPPDAGQLAVGRHTLIFDLTTQESRWDSDFGSRTGPPARGTFTFDVEIVPKLEDAMKPVSSPELDAAVLASIGATGEYSHLFSPAPQSGGFVFEAAIDAHPELQRIAVAGTAYLLRDDVEVARAKFALPEIDARMRVARGGVAATNEVCFCGVPELSRVAAADAAELARWSVRVESTTGWGLLARWSCDRYWRGSFTLPLTGALERERARGGPKARAWVSDY